MISIDIPDSAWQANDGLADPRSRLIAPEIVINGCSLHLEAWEVRTVDDLQVPTAAEDEGDLDALYNAVNGTGRPFSTVQIAGREYVLLATPYNA
ncbi:MAG: hypothetical protein EHM13_06395 [Acidobacteria bacterium]|nr:MAG: hypothetical protein EHM13_06395 [Acidobacteriota bacterium]